ncbi:programmed cell death protein 2-like [Harmonia axyridis]|uniref:programmed cell death protein 2-like n=1 Tax=Harmonia axyridis TaxID=115357 RepID=UPI001E27652B|nr:programmed cell death protein 2-like [Harmonia axyridis]XP_045480261.1 programmed cell death protein 2-like [Harmonia axyridis]XP_045480263.1 programmed cell death protein 2-like [Harmonia axyridis]
MESNSELYSKVDLGYSEPCESWKLSSKFFPSKIGGKPAWLDLDGVPSGEDLSCTKCGDPMTFLCQIYAPYEEDDHNFHRTLFIFVCRKPECHERNKSQSFRLIRSNLKRKNKFYSYEAPEEVEGEHSLKTWLSLCEVCGCVGTKKCSKCHLVNYCSRQHQIIDWKENHKSLCGQGSIRSKKYSAILFPESKINIDFEILDSEETNEEEEKQKYIDLVNAGKSGEDVDEEELAQYITEDPDKTFTKFREEIDGYPDQILRYERGGEPLYISNEEVPKDIPNCEHCGGPRQFEFQIMPQMISIINEANLDWGILLCFTCIASCDGGRSYKNEYIYKQDVSLVDLK